MEMAAKAKSTKKPPMPAKYGKLPAADLDALVAYMQSLNSAGRTVTRRAALARHPLAMAGAVITTVTAVVFIALAIAVLGDARQPLCGPGRLRRHSRGVRDRAAADPVRDVAAAPQAVARIPAAGDWPVWTSAGRGPARGARHRRSPPSTS